MRSKRREEAPKFLHKKCTSCLKNSRANFSLYCKNCKPRTTFNTQKSSQFPTQTNNTKRSNLEESQLKTSLTRVEIEIEETKEEKKQLKKRENTVVSNYQKGNITYDQANQVLKEIDKYLRIVDEKQAQLFKERGEILVELRTNDNPYLRESLKNFSLNPNSIESSTYPNKFLKYRQKGRKKERLKENRKKKIGRMEEERLRRSSQLFGRERSRFRQHKHIVKGHKKKENPQSMDELIRLMQKNLVFEEDKSDLNKEEMDRRYDYDPTGKVLDGLQIRHDFFEISKESLLSQEICKIR